MTVWSQLEIEGLILRTLRELQQLPDQQGVEFGVRGHAGGVLGSPFLASSHERALLQARYSGIPTIEYLSAEDREVY